MQSLIAALPLAVSDWLAVVSLRFLLHSFTSLGNAARS